MTDPQKHDWQRIISELSEMYRDLNGRDLTDYKLGLMLGVTNRSITNLRRPNVQPKHYIGELLLELHAEFSRKITLSQSQEAQS